VTDLSDFDRGFLIGLLVGEGSFGGDGRQPQVVLRMHVRHEAIFRWLQERFPRCRLYGPYHHSGRSYYQWMARGRALVEDLLPLLETEIVAERDEHSAERFRIMCERYAPAIERQRQQLRDRGRTAHGDDGTMAHGDDGTMAHGDDGTMAHRDNGTMAHGDNGTAAA
jgi:hypothetical protein